MIREKNPEDDVYICPGADERHVHARRNAKELRDPLDEQEYAPDYEESEENAS